jgi:hypothetical protein
MLREDIAEPECSRSGGQYGAYLVHGAQDIVVLSWEFIEGTWRKL